MPTAGHYKDIKGLKKGRLTALEITMRKSSNGDYIWKFLCDCGNEFETTIGRFNHGQTKSCGCIVKEGVPKTHGKTKTSEYKTWAKMKERCYNKSDASYKNYGAKGITMCDRWLDDFQNFFDDMGKKPDPNYSIERIDGGKGYSPDNCKWASKFVQSRHRNSSVGASKYKGVCWEESSKKWIAAISVGKIRARKIGRYKNEDDAAAAYNLALDMIFGDECEYIISNNTPSNETHVNKDCKFFKETVYELMEIRKDLY